MFKSVAHGPMRLVNYFQHEHKSGLPKNSVFGGAVLMTSDIIFSLTTGSLLLTVFAFQQHA
jgi:hypothetical protein